MNVGFCIDLGLCLFCEFSNVSERSPDSVAAAAEYVLLQEIYEREETTSDANTDILAAGLQRKTRKVGSRYLVFLFLCSCMNKRRIQQRQRTDAEGLSKH